MTYEYFVSYKFGSNGIGNCSLKLPQKVSSIDDVLEMTKSIEASENLPQDSVIITNYILFDK